MTDDSVVMAHLLAASERATEIIQGVSETMRLDIKDLSKGVVLFRGTDYDELHAYVTGVFDQQGPDWREHWSLPHRDAG